MKIGVFDSGLGGLSVLQHLKKSLPRANFYYVADSANAPYGNKSADFIIQRSIKICDFLVTQKKVDVIVVACNTATAAAVTKLRENIKLPIIAMEPALKPAALKTTTGKVGVLATASTLASEQFQSLVSRYAENIQCYRQAANGLVELIEAGELESEAVQSLLQKYLQPMIAEGVDSIVLGCTHYPFLITEIEKVVGKKVVLIDTGNAVAEQLLRVIKEMRVSDSVDVIPADYFYSTGAVVHAQAMIKKLLNIDVAVESLPADYR